jgi:ATP-binding cassette subfamily B protein
VALARSLLNNPSILVLDDPLSAVDARTERRILDALDRAAQGRTLLLITNRTAAAARCDRILVLDEGRVIESGNHQELLLHGGRYAKLCARQTLERELRAL